MDHHVFENTQLYRQQKKKLVQDHNFLLHSFDPILTKSKKISDPESFIQIEWLSQLDQYGNTEIVFYLGEGRKKYLLGNVKVKNILNRPPEMDKIFFFADGKMIISVIQLEYLKDNQYVYRKKIIPFYLDKVSINKNREILAKDNFKIKRESLESPFLVENYFQFEDQKVAEFNWFLNGQRKNKYIVYSPLLNLVP